MENESRNLASTTGYIMYYDLLESFNGSFFTKIDKAIDLAEEFNKLYEEQEKIGWVDLDWEETLEKFLKLKI